MSNDLFARFSVRSALHLLAVLSLFGLLTVGVVADGRLQLIALMLVPSWILAGLLFVGVARARETGRLLHHLVFAGVVIGGAAAGSIIWHATHGPLPEILALAVSIGVWVGVVWVGARIVYEGPVDTVVTRINTVVREELY
jgi:hypothetical protein